MDQANFLKPKIDSLRFENMTFAYEGQAPIFENLDFNFPMNDYVWVRAGHSGAGRSTLLQILAGLLPVEKGGFCINEKNVSEMSFEEFLPYRLSIGYAFDMGGLLHNRSLFENLMLPLLYHKICSHEEANHRVNLYMQEMGILKYKEQKPSSVQGGVRKITCLIRPLLVNPDVLLLDDPSLGLGQEAVLKYMDLVQDLRREGHAKHVFISSFDEKLMSLIQHQEIFIDAGHIHSSIELNEKKVVAV